MKCPFCSAWSDVLETRDRGGRIYRRRQCANLHTFSTSETIPNRARLLASRNKQAARQVLSGLTTTEVAQAFGMPRSELSRYMKAHHPEHDTRAAGQRRRWAKARGQ